MDREKRKKETTAGKEGCEDGMVGLVDGQNNIDAGGFILILIFSFLYIIIFILYSSESTRII